MDKSIIDKLKLISTILNDIILESSENISETSIQLTEDTYTITDFNTISGKNFESVLKSNIGIPFDTPEKKTMVDKQETFHTSGKVTFIHKRSTNEISAQVFSDNSSKTYVFKKLPNKKFEGMYSYVCFIDVKNPQDTSDQNIDVSDLDFDGTNTPMHSYETDKNQTKNKGDTEDEKTTERITDIVYILSNAFDDTKIDVKLKILSDFMDNINTYNI